MSFTITIVGLGLIGGSLAKSLRGFRDAVILGIDTDPIVCSRAMTDGVVDVAFPDGDTAITVSDLTVLCLYPADCIDFVRHNADSFKPNSLITDVVGVKQNMQSEMDKIVTSACYIGGHPMAGKENGGYANSAADLFKNAQYILTPPPDALEEHVQLLREMCGYIGCNPPVITTAEKHDEMIAYTSQLMHVVAVALCDSPLIDEAPAYSAGSFRDCTRVAAINDRLWSELFIKNKSALTARIEEFESNLEKIKLAVEKDDTEGLRKLMRSAAEKKALELSHKLYYNKCKGGN